MKNKDAAPWPPERLTRLLWSAEPPGLVVREALRFVAEALEPIYAGALEGQSESIHQFRIGLRRLRALLEVFRPVLQPACFKRCRSELRLLGHLVGAVRDNDVLLEDIVDASGRFDFLPHETPAPISKLIAEQRRLAQEKTSDWLGSARYRALMQTVSAAAVVQGESAASVRILLPELIRPLIRTFERTGAKLSRRSQPREFHRLRVKIKPLRYALEMIETAETESTHKAISRLKQIQKILGAQHDVVAAAAWLPEFASSATLPNQALFLTGALHQVFQRRSKKSARRAWRDWKKLAGSAVVQKAQKEIAILAAKAPHRARTLDLVRREGRGVARPAARLEKQAP